MNQKIEKLKEGEKAARNSGISILLLALIKALIGFLSNSLILISDALHSLADFIAIFAAWFGLRISQRKPTEKFPYGYYKAETLATFFISIFILIAAFELLKEGYEKIFSISSIIFPLPALSVALASLFYSYILSRYLEKIGNKINTQSLITSSKEKIVDVFSSFLVFVGILLSFYKVPYVEGILTIGISLLVLKIGIFSIKDSIFGLMDIAPSADLAKKIEELILSSKGIREYKDLKLRKAGPFVFGEVTIKVEKAINVEKAHQIADRLEKEVVKIPEIDSFIIHVEPHEKKEIKVAVPISENKGLNSKLMEHFGRANYFLFAKLDMEIKQIKDFYVKANPYKLEKVKAGLSTAKFLLKEKVDVLLTKQIGEISFHTLRDNLISIFMAKGATAKDAINSFLEGKAEGIEKPTKKEEETIEAKLRPGWGKGFGRRRGPWWLRWQ